MAMCTRCGPCGSFGMFIPQLCFSKQKCEVHLVFAEAIHILV